MRSVTGGVKNPANGSAFWEPNASFWTAALGVQYLDRNGWKFGLFEKYTGQQYSDTANLNFYGLPAYGDLSATIGYAFGNYEVDLTGDNLTNGRAATMTSEATNNVAQTSPATSLDQYFFQAPMSLQVTLKAHF